MRNFIGKPVDQLSPYRDKNGRAVKPGDLIKVSMSGQDYLYYLVAFNQNYNGEFSLSKMRLKNRFSGGYSWSYMESLSKEWEVVPDE